MLEFVRIVSELGARTFMFENVKGLTIGQHKAFLYELVQAFEGAGYDVRLPWLVLDAAHYGVPQHRERLILIGAKKGARLPDYPVPRTNPADAKKLVPAFRRGQRAKTRSKTCPMLTVSTTLIEADSVPPRPLESRLRMRGSCVALNGRIVAPRLRAPMGPGSLTSSARTSHTEISCRRFTETEPGDVEPISRFFKLPAGGLSNTLRAGTDGARGAFTSPAQSTSRIRAHHGTRDGAPARVSRLVPVSCD